MSTIVFRPCSAMLLWLFARMQPSPVMIQMLASPRPGFSADMHLSGSDSFARPEEDAIAFAIEQAWHRLCHQAPHFFWKRIMCRYRSIEEGQALRAGESSDAVILSEVGIEYFSAIGRYDIGMHLIDCLFQLSIPHVVPMDHCPHHAQGKMAAADKRQPLPKRWLPLCTSVGPA